MIQFVRKNRLNKISRRYQINLVSSRFSNDLVHFFNLSQCSLVSTQSLLSELSGSLLTGVSDQFDHSSLVRSQTADFLDDVSDELSSLGQSTLSVRDLWCNNLGVDLVTFVQTSGNT